MLTVLSRFSYEALLIHDEQIFLNLLLDFLVALADRENVLAVFIHVEEKLDARALAEDDFDHLKVASVDGALNDVVFFVI